MALFHSFLWLSDIPFCVCGCRKSLSILSSDDGHLGSFHVLAIADSAAVNIGVPVSFQVTLFILSRYMPNSGIAGSCGNSNFSFSILFSIRAPPIYIPTNSIAEFFFLHTLSRICICWLLDDGHSDSCEMISQVVLICISLIISDDIEHFSYACWPSVCLMDKRLGPLPFLRWVVAFLLLSCVSCLYILKINPFQQCHVQIYSPVP